MAKWIDRLSLVYLSIWERASIEKFIYLTQIAPLLCLEMVAGSIYLWSCTYNSFILFMGPMFITLEDIHILTSLPVTGEDAPNLIIEPTCHTLPLCKA